MSAEDPLVGPRPTSTALLHRDRRAEFGAFLRSRRDRLRPAEVGLPERSRRRTPGLRREEVAHLANISTTYYTFLEQGRDVTPSSQVLSALARALRLTPAETQTLLDLAHGGDRPAPAGPEALTRSLRTLLEQLDPSPAYITGGWWDVLATNRAGRLIFGNLTPRPARNANLLWWLFTDPTAQLVYTDWHAQAAAHVGRFRPVASRWAGHPEIDGLVEQLSAHSPTFERLWSRHDVLPSGEGRSELRHPDLGAIPCEVTVLLVADRPEQRVVTFTPAAVDRRRISSLIG